MDRQEWNNLEEAYQKAIESCKIIDPAKVNGSNQARMLNATFPVARSSETIERDHHNTEAAISAREKKAQEENQRKLDEFRISLEKELYEDYGGSRDAALQQHLAWLEQKRQSLEGQLKEEYNKESPKEHLKTGFRKQAPKQAVITHFNTKSPNDNSQTIKGKTDASKEFKERMKKRLENKRNNKIDKGRWL